MKLTIIIPVYNEESTIGEILQRVLNVHLEKEVIVVDDGSTDGTGQVLARWKGRDFFVLRHPCNLGKGAAIRTALEKTTGEIVVIQDADLEYDPEDYVRLMQPILQGNATVVYGSRVLGTPEYYKMSPFEYYRLGYFNSLPMTLLFFYGRKIVTWLTNILYGTRLTDQPTCYKMFRRELLQEIQLTSTGFEFCSEFTAKLALAGHSIVEVPISYHPRKDTEGKKLNWKDGLKAVLTLLRIRLHRR